MPWITADQLSYIQSDLAAVLLHIAAIDEGLAGPILAGGLKSFTIDSGTGKSQEVFGNPLELFALRKILCATRDRLTRSLNGETILTTRLRR